VTTILGISGSLRQASYNSGLLRAARDLRPAHIELASIAGIPLFNADEEAEGMPAAVTALRQRVLAADGLLLASPEYNNSVPGVAKNAIDWLSRASSDTGNVFKGKAVAIIGATPGGFGTIMGQSAWLPVMRTLRARIWTGGRLLVSGAGNHFDERGDLVDGELRKRLDDFLEGFLHFCAG